MMTEKTFTVGEFTMNYGEGPQTGPPLVFLHGATTWWKDFEPLQPLTKNWHIYACDMRGHGKSSRTPGKYRAVDFAPDIVTFTQKQIQEPVVLIGHSMGGIVALLTAAQVPEWIRAIILLDPATVVHNTLLQAMPAWTQVWFTGVGDVLESRRSAKDFILEFNPAIDELGLHNVELMIRSVDPEFVSLLVNDKFFDGLQLEQELAKVLCAALLLYGEFELGSIVPEAEVEFLKQHILQTTTVRIQAAGHAPHWEQTEATLRYINDFLKTI